MPDELDFERPLLELENRIAELRASDEAPAARDEIGRLEERLRRLQHKVYGSLTPWQRAQLARHPKRPHTLDLFRLLLEVELEFLAEFRFLAAALRQPTQPAKKRPHDPS